MCWFCHCYWFLVGFTLGVRLYLTINREKKLKWFRIVRWMKYKLLNNKQSKIETQQHNHYHLKLVSFCLLESNLHISEMNYVWRWFFHSSVFSKIFFFRLASTLNGMLNGELFRWDLSKKKHFYSVIFSYFKMFENREAIYCRNCCFLNDHFHHCAAPCLLAILIELFYRLANSIRIFDWNLTWKL